MRGLRAAIAAGTVILSSYASADVEAGASSGFGLIILLIVAVFYFIPTMVASNRGHLSVAAIFMFNLFLGWTFLGWVLALVWSLTSNTKANAERYSGPTRV